MVNSFSKIFQEKIITNPFDSKLSDNPKKVKHFQKITKNSLNFILFGFVFLLLPKSSFETCYTSYIELTVNQYDRLIQVISDYYSDSLPSEFGEGDGTTFSSPDKRYASTSANHKIQLYWSSCHLSNFANMFRGVTTITEVYMHNIFYYNNNDLSDMFRGCTNLVKFSSNINYNNRPSVGNARGMFYNCISLTSFSFTHLFFDYHRRSCDGSCTNYFRKVSMAQMFYNCQNLRLIETKNDNYNYNFGLISDMKEMFYNCISLISFDLRNFITKSSYKINLSYMFYNCKSLISVFGNFYSFAVSDSRFMFYNCISLISIEKVVIKLICLICFIIVQV